LSALPRAPHQGDFAAQSDAPRLGPDRTVVAVSAEEHEVAARRLVADDVAEARPAGQEADVDTNAVANPQPDDLGIRLLSIVK
jgi:hypothetical protein